ncbi:UNVERIFIED_CONTAM: hypothetical protein O8I53_11295 [Campylobacter lari]
MPETYTTEEEVIEEIPVAEEEIIEEIPVTKEEMVYEEIPAPQIQVIDYTEKTQEEKRPAKPNTKLYILAITILII